jgi:hypothetical protein
MEFVARKACGDHSVNLLLMTALFVVLGARRKMPDLVLMRRWSYPRGAAVATVVLFFRFSSSGFFPPDSAWCLCGGLYSEDLRDFGAIVNSPITASVVRAAWCRPFCVRYQGRGGERPAGGPCMYVADDGLCGLTPAR